MNFTVHFGYYDKFLINERRYDENVFSRYLSHKIDMSRGYEVILKFDNIPMPIVIYKGDDLLKHYHLYVDEYDRWTYGFKNVMEAIYAAEEIYAEVSENKNANIMAI